MKIQLITAFVAVCALAGCDSKRENVREAQQDVQEARQEAAKDVADAQAEAVQDVNATKEDAAADIRDAQKDLVDAQRDATTSGTTRSADEVKVTAEQCAKFAINKTVKPEDKALYDACSKIDEKKFR